MRIGCLMGISLSLSLSLSLNDNFMETDILRSPEICNRFSNFSCLDRVRPAGWSRIYFAVFTLLEISVSDPFFLIKMETLK